MKYRVAIPFHSQTRGQVDVFNWEIKSILGKTMNVNRMDWAKILDDALWA